MYRYFFFFGWRRKVGFFFKKKKIQSSIDSLTASQIMLIVSHFISLITRQLVGNNQFGGSRCAEKER